MTTYELSSALVTALNAYILLLFLKPFIIKRIIRRPPWLSNLTFIGANGFTSFSLQIQKGTHSLNTFFLSVQSMGTSTPILNSMSISALGWRRSYKGPRKCSDRVPCITLKAKMKGRLIQAPFHLGQLPSEHGSFIQLFVLPQHAKPGQPYHTKYQIPYPLFEVQDGLKYSQPFA
jgi:hypothetical protein